MQSEDSAKKEALRRAVAAYVVRNEWPLLLIMLPPFMPVIVFIMLLCVSGGRSDPHENFKQSKQQYESEHPVLADENNAAIDYRSADAVLSAQQERRPIELCRIGDYYALPQVRRFIESNGETLAHLLTASEKSACEWGEKTPKQRPIDEFALLNLLQVYARCCAHKGEHEKAAQALKSAYKLIDRLNSDFACTSANIDQIANAILFWDTPQSTADLEHYRQALGSERDARSRALRKLKAFRSDVVYALDGIASGNLTPSRYGWIGAYAPTPGSVRMMWYAGERKSFHAILDALTKGLDDGDKTLRWYEYVRKHATAPMPFCDKRHLAINAYFDDEESFRVTEAGMAVLKFRLKHGRDPLSLKELVPEFLPAVPRAVFRDVELSLKTDAEGINLGCDPFDPVEFQRRYGEREVLRINGPGRVEMHSDMGCQFVLPPLWNSARQEARK
ncbi:MAG TPA: hypothetical protein VEK08_05245 [Planctomycetota bacterium]|nr:hypothetical protein [Planctomycetota bacterium]